MDEDINLDHLCLINFIIDSSKSDNSLSIPKNAWKLLIQVYGKEIKKFTDAWKLLEAQLIAGKPLSPQPTQTLPSMPKVDVLPKQYKAHTKVNLLLRNLKIPLPLIPSHLTDRHLLWELKIYLMRHVSMAFSSCLQHVSYLNPTIPVIPLDIGG